MLIAQFPDYLADHRSKLTQEQYLAYNKQCDLTRYRISS